MNVTLRACSHCRNQGHDIRNCAEYINHIDAILVRDFTDNGNNAVFPLFNHRILQKLAEKYGISRTLPNNVLYERLILIYSHFGEQNRLERRNRRNEENRRRLLEERAIRENDLPLFVINQDPSPESIAQVVIPFPIRPAVERFRNMISLQDLNALRYSFQQLTIELTEEIDFRLDEWQRSKPEFVMDDTKFTETNRECECPICYENKPSVITNCDHLYCQTCIDTMIEIRNDDVKCALCRETVNKIYFPSIPETI
jgi:hypothetical protein